MKYQTTFQRLNFFTGFLTEKDDWLQGQQYHLEKLRLHNRGLHTQGIISDEGDELKVIAHTGLSVQVLPGAAVDGEGNILYLVSPKVVSPPTELTDLPKTMYVFIKYSETPTDWRLNPEDPDYSGYARISEEPEIGCSFDCPDNNLRIELARVHLQPGVTAISDPQDSEHPGTNEIDHRYVKWAGAKDVDEERLLDRIRRLHTYQLEKQRRHNRGLYAAGLMHDVEDELAVVPSNGLTVEVRPGAALNGDGDEIYLGEPTWIVLAPAGAVARIYIVARYNDRFGEYLSDLNRPFSGTYSTAQIEITHAEPDNRTSMELARLDLESTATEVRLPVDPARPQHNELDFRFRRWAAAKAVVEVRLAPELRGRIVLLMRDKRDGFTKLSARFPVPAACDTRQAALAVETLVRNDSLRPDKLTEMWIMLAELEQDVGQQIGATYPPVVEKPEYQRYQQAVDALLASLRIGGPDDVLLNRQAEVVAAARDLAEVIFEAPRADAGPDQTLPTLTGQADVKLDASGSQAYDDQKIVRYRWDKEA